MAAGRQVRIPPPGTWLGLQPQHSQPHPGTPQPAQNHAPLPTRTQVHGPINPPAPVTPHLPAPAPFLPAPMPQTPTPMPTPMHSPAPIPLPVLPKSPSHKFRNISLGLLAQTSLSFLSLSITTSIGFALLPTAGSAAILAVTGIGISLIPGALLLGIGLLIGRTQTKTDKTHPPLPTTAPLIQPQPQSFPVFPPPAPSTILPLSASKLLGENYTRDLAGLRRMIDDYRQLKANGSTDLTAVEDLRLLIQKTYLEMGIESLKLNADTPNMGAQDYYILPALASEEPGQAEMVKKTGHSQSYRHGRLIGVGGFAQVYLAVDMGTGHLVAVKQLTTTSERTHDRFTREIRIMLALQKGKKGLMQILASRKNYYVMEYLDPNGPEQWQTLQSVIRSGNMFTPLQALHILRAVIGVLETCTITEGSRRTARTNRVWHRDIKPANIFISWAELSRGRVVIKVADLGLSKTVGSSGDTTDTGDTPCTPAYSSPWYLAQYDSAAVDPVLLGKILENQDIFGLCAMAYSLLARKNPLWGKVGPDGKTALHTYHVGSTDEVSDRLNGLPGTASRKTITADFTLLADARTRGDEEQQNRIRLKHVLFPPIKNPPAPLLILFQKGLAFDPSRAFQRFAEFKVAVEAALTYYAPAASAPTHFAPPALGDRSDAHSAILPSFSSGSGSSSALPEITNDLLADIARGNVEIRDDRTRNKYMTAIYDTDGLDRKLERAALGHLTFLRFEG